MPFPKKDQVTLPLRQPVFCFNRFVFSDFLCRLPLTGCLPVVHLGEQGTRQGHDGKDREHDHLSATNGPGLKPLPRPFTAWFPAKTASQTRRSPNQFAQHFLETKKGGHFVVKLKVQQKRHKIPQERPWDKAKHCQTMSSP